MSINSAAYIAETTRAAILSVDKLQQDAGLSVGLTLWQTMLYVQLPQALRVAIPSFGNTFIGIIQGTALTFMLGLNDLMGLGKMKAAIAKGGWHNAHPRVKAFTSIL
ncbi:ABC transporter permease subunit [Acetoanaerobium sticklandii]|uniref:ABC transporter permease subunit n=1 Tax=Acetoanaerobium sticklandii TaxID=1511 RepID=UPI003A903DAA